ncbi:MAG: hypothetical protein JWM10_3565 [Myxococcaceae bacterium]|nr:hypothetical protein [Myxococcaceae bacterium]
MDPKLEALSADLAAAAVRALSDDWRNLNYALFQDRMRPPGLRLSEASGFLARWMRTERAIEVSRAFLLAHPWGVVQEVLKHEMAHQFVDEVIGVRDETAHGPVFQRVCADRGIDGGATGVPESTGGPDAATASALDKIAKLLALANSPNEHEAQTAMNTAQKLMLKYNLDAVRAKAARGYSYKHLGEPSGRVEESSRYLAAILSEHFFVQCIWVNVWRVREGRGGSVLEVVGTPENVSMAEYVHSFLDHTADARWTLHKREQRITGDRDRRAFRTGVMMGFLEKLRAERKGQKETGLVWAGDPALDDYYHRRYPRIRSISRSAVTRTAAHAEGHQAGKSLVLHKGVDGGRGRPGGGGLLGPGGG